MCVEGRGNTNQDHIRFRKTLEIVRRNEHFTDGRLSNAFWCDMLDVGVTAGNDFGLALVDIEADDLDFGARHGNA